MSLVAGKPNFAAWKQQRCRCAFVSAKSRRGPRCEKTCLRGFANNTGADQPAHPRSLISAFVIRVLESTVSKLATSESSIF